MLIERYSWSKYHTKRNLWLFILIERSVRSHISWTQKIFWAFVRRRNLGIWVTIKRKKILRKVLLKNLHPRKKLYGKKFFLSTFRLNFCHHWFTTSTFACWTCRIYEFGPSSLHDQSTDACDTPTLVLKLIHSSYFKISKTSVIFIYLLYLF